MASDFYVEFGSNAPEWAAALEGQLQPARNAITHLQAMLNTLDATARSVGGGELARALATKLPPSVAPPTQGDGGNTAPPPASAPGMSHKAQQMSNEMLDNMSLASEELYKMMGAMARGVTLFESMPTTIESAMDKMAETIGKAQRSATAKVRTAEQQGQGNGTFFLPGTGHLVAAGTKGALQHGTPEADVYGIIAQAVRKGAASLGGQAVSARYTPSISTLPTHISTISRIPKSALDQAGIDRIVNSIEAQTRSLESALSRLTVQAAEPSGGRAPAPANVVSAPTKESAAVKTAVETATPAVDSDEELLKKVLAAQAKKQELIKELAPLAAGDPAMAAAVEAAQNEVDAAAAQIKSIEAKKARKLDRETRGVTRAQQSEENRLAAAQERANRPEITSDERERRLEQLTHINSAIDPNFKSMVGRGPTKYGMDDLKQMAAALTEAGFPVDYKSRTRMPQLTQLIAQAGQQYRAQYQGGDVPEALQTKGFNVIRSDKISEPLQQLLGDLNRMMPHVLARAEAADMLSKDARSGGDVPDGPISASARRSGAKVAKGRLGYGAVTGEMEGMLFTPEQIDHAREVLRTLPSEHDYAAKMIQRPGFDPYGPDTIGAIGGRGDTAAAGRLALNAVRAATTDIDEFGVQLAAFNNKISENAQLISRILRRQEQGTSFPTDQEKLPEARALLQEGAQQRRDLIANRPSFVNEDVLKAVQSPGFLEEAAARQASRLSFQQRDLSSQRDTVMTSRDIQSAVTTAIAGRRTALRSREWIGNFPQLTTTGSNGTLTLTNTEGMARGAQEKLTKALEHFSATELNRLKAEFHPTLIGPLDEKATARQDVKVAEEAAKLENAAVRLANQLQKTVGLAPSVRDLTGRDVQNPKNIEGELKRQEARDAANYNMTRKFTDTPEQALERATNLVATLESRLAQEREKLAGTTEKVRIEEERLAERNAGVTDSEVARIRALSEEKNAIEATHKGLTDELRERKSAVTGAQAELRRLIPGQRPDLEQGAQSKLEAAQQSLAAFMPKFEASQAELSRAQKAWRDAQGGDTGGSAAALQVQRAEAEGRRKNLLSQVESARQEGDLSENAGYAAARDALGKVNAEIDAIDQKLSGQLPHLGQELDATSKEIARLSKELESAKNSVNKAESAIKKAGSEKAETQATEASVAAINARIAALREERAQLQAQPHGKTVIDPLLESQKSAQKLVSTTKGQITRATNKGDSERASELQSVLAAREADLAAAKAAVEQARSVAARLKAIRRELKELGGGGSGSDGVGGSGGSGGSGAAGGKGANGGGRDRDLLSQILGVLKQIDGKLGRGIKVTGTTAEGSKITNAVSGDKTKSPFSREIAAAGQAKTAPKWELDAVRAYSETKQITPEFEAAQEAQRRRQARLRESEVGSAQDAAYKEQARKEGQVASAAEKTASAMRMEFQEHMAVEEAMKRLTPATAAEVSELKRLTRQAEEAATAEARLAAEQRVAQQQVRVHAAVSADLQAQGYSGTAQRNTAKTVLSHAGPEINTQEFDQIARTARASFATAGGQWAEASAQSFGGRLKALFGAHGFWDRIVGSSGTFLVRNFSAGFVFGLTNMLQEAVTEGIKTQQTFVRVSATLQATGKDVGSLRTDLQSISSSYGVALNDMYDTAAKLAGVFQNSEELTGGTKAVAQLQAISEGALSADESVGAITSIWAAFQDQLKNQGGAEHITDVATALQNLTGTNIEDTVEGVARLAGMAKQMGISFEETSTFVAQISRETNTTGATAGEQLSRILSQMQTSGGQGALKQAFGADIFSRNTIKGAINYGDVLKDMIGSWGKLSKAQQDSVTHTIAGSRQAATFSALMDNGAKTMQNLGEAMNSQGAGAERMAKLMDTLNGQLSQLKSNFHNLVTELLQTGVLNFLGAFLKGTNSLLKGLDSLLAHMNQFAEGNPVAGAIMHIITTLGGAYLAVKLLTSSWKGLQDAMAAREGLSAGAKMLSTVPIIGPRMTAGRTAVAEGEQLIAAKQVSRPLFGSAEDAETAAVSAQAAMAAKRAKALNVLMATEGQAAELMEARNVLEAERIKVLATGTAGEAEAAALAQQVALADAELVKVLEMRAAAEAEAAGASRLGSAASGAKGLLGKAAGGLMKALPYAAAAYFIVDGFKGQSGRADESLKEAQSVKTPDQGATGEEWKAAAKSAREALAKSQDLESKGFFGTGIGPSINKAITGLVQGDKYDKIDAQQANLKAISRSMDSAAVAMREITKEDQGQLGGSAIKTPAITSFDSAYLSTRLQTLTANGQSAAVQLRELSDTLNGVGESARQATGSFSVGGKPTNDLGRWVDAVNPGILKILQKQGVDVSNGGLNIKQLLGYQHQEQGMNSDGSVTTTNVVNPRSSWTARNTSQAVKQVIDKYSMSPNMDPNIKSFQARLKDLQSRGFTDEAKQYKNIHDGLVKYFSADLKTYRDLIGQASLTRKDTMNLINIQSQLVGQKISDMPATDLSGRAAAAKGLITQIRGSIAKSKSGASSQMLVALQAARNQYADAALAELDATRKAAQTADHSKAGLRRAGMAEIRQGIAIAVKQGAADSLANLINSAGASSVALAKAAIAAERTALARYIAMVNEINALQPPDALAGTPLANVLDPTATSKQTDKINQWRHRINHVANAIKNVTPGSDKNSAILTGSDVPAVQDAKDAQGTANQARQDAAALLQARLGAKQAYDDAHGYAVAGARVQVEIAKAAIGAARADIAAATTASERSQATAALYSAEAQLYAANAAVQQAQADFVKSQYDVSIALATAAGHTVEAAVRTSKQARAALHAAMKRSGGRTTAETNAAKAQLIQTEAAERDAKLQDAMDTIDFNLQMGKMTQSAAIHAYQMILRNADLTKAQRRQLMLQIKGMKDQMADDQWNFGDISLPTPYQMRRYIKEQKQQAAGDLAPRGRVETAGLNMKATGPSTNPVTTTTINNRTTIQIDGADVAKVKKIIQDVVGSSASINTRTTGARRGR